MAQMGRVLGMDRTLRRHLSRYRGAPLTLLDVGTGSGHLLTKLIRWGGSTWRGVGIDLHPDVVSLLAARQTAEGGVRFLRTDALRLPFADDSVDVGFSNLMLHHLSDREAIRLIEEMTRVCRREVILNDLERHPVNALGAKLLSETVWAANPLTKSDGPISVRRAFTLGELRTLLDRAGIPGATVRRHMPYRLVIRVELS